MAVDRQSPMSGSSSASGHGWSNRSSMAAAMSEGAIGPSSAFTPADTRSPWRPHACCGAECVHASQAPRYQIGDRHQDIRLDPHLAVEGQHMVAADRAGVATARNRCRRGSPSSSSASASTSRAIMVTGCAEICAEQDVRRDLRAARVPSTSRHHRIRTAWRGQRRHPLLQIVLASSPR